MRRRQGALSLGGAVPRFGGHRFLRVRHLGGITYWAGAWTRCRYETCNDRGLDRLESDRGSCKEQV